MHGPYGGTFVEEDDAEDPWGSLDDGEAYGVGGLGLTGTSGSVPTVRPAKAEPHYWLPSHFMIGPAA